MELVSHFERLIAHDEWANRKLADSLRTSASDAAIRLFAHLVATEFVWLDRLAQGPQRCAVWPAWNLDEIAARLEEPPIEWRKLLRGPNALALDSRVGYVNTKGEHFVNTVADIATHTLLHSTYHRGQIARAQREVGEAPAGTDFTLAVREGCLDSLEG